MTANFTNEIRDERHLRTLMAVDYYCEKYDLCNNPISVELNMAELYLSSGDLVDLLNSINVMRHGYGIKRLKAGSIKHPTKLRYVLKMLDQS